MEDQQPTHPPKPKKPALPSVTPTKPTLVFTYPEQTLKFDLSDLSADDLKKLLDLAGIEIAEET